MIALILGLVIIGVVLQLLKDKLTIEPTILVLIQVIIVLSVVCYLMAIVGILDLPVPRLTHP